MKMKTIWFVVILILVSTIFINLNFNNNEEEFKPLELNVGDVFNNVEYKNTMYVINYGIGDVTGDNESDMIILVGEKEDVSSNFSKNVDLVIYDTKNKTFSNANIKKLEGSLAKIILSDLTNDNINDIIISLEKENKEKDVRILTSNDNSLKEIFGVKDNKGINFVGEVIDGVKAHVKCTKLNKELYLDLADKKEDLKNKKYIDESGKVICENKKIKTSSFLSIEQIKINDENAIQTTQIITAFDTNEIIDEITAIWKYENGKWQIKEAKGTKMGNLIY